MVHIAVEMAPICKVGWWAEGWLEDGAGSVAVECRHGGDVAQSRWNAATMLRVVGRDAFQTSEHPHSRPPYYRQVGGLGDVVTALGRAVQEEGHTVEVILPRWAGWVGGSHRRRAPSAG